MNAFVKLGIGAVLLGVGFVVSMQAQRELIAKWAAPCEDCDEETAEQLEDVKSFIDQAEERDQAENEQ